MQHASEPLATDDQIGYLLKRAQHAVRGAMDAALERHGVTMARYAVLSALEAAGGVSNAELARRCFVTPQTMNQLLAATEDAGLVRRKQDPGHGRIIERHLTDAGADLLARCHDSAARVHERMLFDLSPDERDQLRRWLLSCVEALDDGFEQAT
jgi:DNA-binding MarR family transcriptional regulator